MIKVFFIKFTTGNFQTWGHFKLDRPLTNPMGQWHWISSGATLGRHVIIQMFYIFVQNHITHAYAFLIFCILVFVLCYNFYSYYLLWWCFYYVMVNDLKYHKSLRNRPNLVGNDCKNEVSIDWSTSEMAYFEKAIFFFLEYRWSTLKKNRSFKMAAIKAMIC